MSAILLALFSAIFSTIRGWFSDRLANSNAKDLGAANAANETSQVIQEAADARSKIVVPAGAADLERELRDAAKAAGGSAVGNDGH